MKKVYNKFLNKIGLFSIAFRIAHIVYSYSKMQFRLLKLAAKSGAKIDHTSRIFYDNAEDLIISKNVIIGANSIIFCTNEDNANSFSSQIIIGEGTYIGEMNNIRSGGGKIEIGKKCLISQHVNIIGSNHSTDPIKYIMDQPWDSMKIGVSIGDDVWIGAGATILPGVKIGKGSIVAAGAVVIKDIDPYTIHAGVPARFIKNRK